MSATSFEVSTTITRDGCRAQAQARIGQHRREIYVLLAGLALATAILFAIHSQHADTMLGVTAIIVLYDVLMIPMTAERLYSSRNTAVDSIWLSFGEEDMFVSTNVEETYIEYDQVTHIYANSRFIVLCAKHHAPLVFKKTEVLGQRADELIQFLVNRTGKELRSFHG